VAAIREGETPPSSNVSQVLSLPLDLTNLESMRAGVQRVAERWGRVSGAVLCAGGWEGGKAVIDTGSETWQRMFQSNFETARVCTTVLAAHMKERGGGSIVAIGSRAAERPWESASAAAYAASKAAVVSLIKTTAQEMLGTGVRLNAVLPSTLDTPANRAAMPQANFSRWVALTELNQVIAFLLSQASSAVTGAALPVYGRL
jgi:NAD(P)-dependent dehydrogenase (short-subunit alcohol dehydrogenase family)